MMVAAWTTPITAAIVIHEVAGGQLWYWKSCHPHVHHVVTPDTRKMITTGPLITKRALPFMVKLFMV